MRQRIAIVGSGISGLGAAWALCRDHDVVVFEKDTRIGGHSNTVDVAVGGHTVAVDTGFIVYNEVTYPNLTELFGRIGVRTEWSDMSFSFSLDGGIEYATRPRGLIRPANLLDRRFQRMLRDMGRFRREGRLLDPGPAESIAEVLARHGYSDGFVEDYLLPMTGAIWSARQDRMGRFPARTVLEFLGNHGLIEVVGRPRWRTVTGGSRHYVERLVRPFADRIRTATPVGAVTRQPDGVIVDTAGRSERFDQLVLATHTDQARSILGNDATTHERTFLGAIPYESNRLVLHGDRSLMPRRRSCWASWNALGSPERRFGRSASVTYWMNRLQNLADAPPLFASLNPLRPPDPSSVHAAFDYDHPQFDHTAIEAQDGIRSIQGRNRTWFAGAWLGYGFHEDGLRAGLEVAAALGSPVPWHTPASGATRPMTRGASR